MEMLAKLQAMRAGEVKRKAQLLNRIGTLQKSLDKSAATIIQLDHMIKMEGGNGIKPLGIIDGAERVFEANHGLPMTVRDLTARLMQLGVQTESMRFAATVYATIRQSPKFVRLSSGLWQRTQDAPPPEVASWQKRQKTFVAKVKKKRGSRKKQ